MLRAKSKCKYFKYFTIFSDVDGAVLYPVPSALNFPLAHPPETNSIPNYKIINIPQQIVITHIKEAVLYLQAALKLILYHCFSFFTILFSMLRAKMKLEYSSTR